MPDICTLLCDLRDECAFASASEAHNENTNRSSDKSDNETGRMLSSYREDGAFWLNRVTVRAVGGNVLDELPCERIGSSAS